MQPEQLLNILSVAERLKCSTRHSDTSSGRRESVAEHSWRLSLLAMLISYDDAFKALDMDKVIRMCLIHDLGEAFTGDIPSFEKSSEHSGRELLLYRQWIDTFPETEREAFHTLLDEMEQLQTPEAKTYKALDKMEAVIQHNEADIAGWLPLEYDLQLTYGKAEAAFSPYLARLREAIGQMTLQKIAQAKRPAGPCPGAGAGTKARSAADKAGR